MRHKLRRAVRREVQHEVRRQMTQLKQELLSAQIHLPTTRRESLDAMRDTLLRIYDETKPEQRQ